MTLTEWARELGVAVSTVSGWENGTGEPNWTQVRKMSELSGIPLDYIFVPEKSE
jgi:DNA-binding XRE family transcriptional regulator